MAVAMADATGTYSMKGIAPGKYKLLALDETVTVSKLLPEP